MPLLTETEHIMTEEELKVKFDYIQGIFNRCINYACQILIDSIIVKVRYLNGEQADELERQEYIHAVNELAQLYIRYSALNDIQNFYSVPDFFWESGFYEALKPDEKRKYLSFSPLSFNYSQYAQDNTVYDEELPYFSMTQEEDLDEKIVEKAIVANVKKFIMTFGQDFSFIGNQYRMEVAGEEMFIDLLFFNRELNSLVAVELKSGKFRTSYLGQLNTYLSALDTYIRKPHENPSIGIILCREMNQTFVEFAVRDYNKPMGVATYRASKDMPERLRNALPDIEDLKKLL